MRELDETDAEILRLLVEDARRPFSDIAEAVDLSALAVHDRIERLREVGVIRRFTADVTLVRDDPVDVVKAVRVSAATLAKIRQNLGWALGYNVAMIPLASIGLLQPALAAAAMAFSSVSVLANSLAFRRYTPDEDYHLLGRWRSWGRAPTPGTDA